MMNRNLQTKLKTLPSSPGVYFHKSTNGEIIYVGKAAVLKNRVRQYFQNQRNMDVKTRVLVSEIADTEWVETESEIDALFLEAEMIKRYMPRYNILLRDDKSQTFIRIDMKSERPYVSYTRNPDDDGAEYFGPYYNGVAIKKALRYLRRVFPYYTRPPKLGERPDLDIHLGLSPNGMTSNEYKTNLRRLISYIKGERKKLLAELEAEMRLAAQKQDYEKAAVIRNRINNLRELRRRIMFGDKEFLDISKDAALNDLTELLNLSKPPVRIEGYDISHMSGVDVVASMVVFTNGTSNRSEYRKFKTRLDQNNDFYNMGETLSRRLSDKNLRDWGKPDLILIDGGKGQLNVALTARNACGQLDIPFIGLAKNEEQIIVNDLSVDTKKVQELGGWVEQSDNFVIINLPKNSNVVKLLQRIRDEAHRFAVSYHTTLKRARQTSSDLEKIPGIGPKTRAKLIRKFGSLRAVKKASQADVADLIGDKKAALVARYTQAL